MVLTSPLKIKGLKTIVKIIYVKNNSQNSNRKPEQTQEDRMLYTIHSRMGIAMLIFVSAVCLFLSVSSHAAAQDVVVVVNNSMGTDSVSAEDITAIFLGKKSTWDSGEPVVFAIFDDAEAQSTFMKEYLQKNPSQFKNYWKKIVFTGKGRMPKYLKSESEVQEFVNAYPGGISFLPAASQKAVKVLNVK